MKTEEQVTEKLEKCVEHMNRLGADLGNGDPPVEKKIEIACSLGFLIAFGYVLDCETQIRQMLAASSLASIADKLNAAFA